MFGFIVRIITAAGPVIYKIPGAGAAAQKIAAQLVNNGGKIIKPPKGEKVVLKCMIDCDDMFEDVKKQLTYEIEKHKILSKDQIILIESDKNFKMVPFIVEELEPSNVIDITNVDLPFDFSQCLEYDDPMESLIIKLNN